jgi:hypothetical protein
MRKRLNSREIDKSFGAAVHANELGKRMIEIAL